jgi:hypothetical protein
VKRLKRTAIDNKRRCLAVSRCTYEHLIRTRNVYANVVVGYQPFSHAQCASVDVMHTSMNYWSRLTNNTMIRVVLIISISSLLMTIGRVIFKTSQRIISREFVTMRILWNMWLLFVSTMKTNSFTHSSRIVTLDSRVVSLIRQVLIDFSRKEYRIQIFDKSDIYRRDIITIRLSTENNWMNSM